MIACSHYGCWLSWMPIVLYVFFNIIIYILEGLAWLQRPNPRLSAIDEIFHRLHSFQHPWILPLGDRPGLRTTSWLHVQFC